MVIDMITRQAGRRKSGRLRAHGLPGSQSGPDTVKLSIQTANRFGFVRTLSSYPVRDVGA